MPRPFAFLGPSVTIFLWSFAQKFSRYLVALGLHGRVGGQSVYIMDALVLLGLALSDVVEPMTTSLVHWQDV